MSDKLSNHELDDELLSAYLDGELSADDRAAVEVRLATDQAAQQLLHELRSVSQSVQALPTESLGRDVSEDVLRRAREAKPVPAAAKIASTSTSEERSRSDDSIPKIRIFTSRRAWIWASMALAAGLLMMIVQSGDESTNKLPPIAAKNREVAQTKPADEAVQLRRREISISAAPESPSLSPATVASDSELHDKVDALRSPISAAAPTTGEAAGGRLSGIARDDAAASPPGAAARPAPVLQKEREKAALNAGDASSTLSATPGQVAFDKLPDASQPTGGQSGPGGAPGFAAEKQKSESIVSPNAGRLVVVRVVAKPDALKNGSFERLLADNKIEFVPQPAKNQPLSIGGGKLPAAAKSEGVVKEQLNKSGESHPLNMVLVEAPAPTIESCLAALNKNSSDFPSIDVSEEPQSHDRFDAKSTPTKKLAETSKNLGHFSRGNVPETQKDTIDPRYYFYSYDFDRPNESAATGSPRDGGFGGEAGTISGIEQDAKLGYKGQPSPDVRRARSIETRQAGEPASARGRAARIQIQSGAQAPNQPMSQQNPAGSAEAKADTSANNLKVLFVFTTEEKPTPSAPPDDRPK